MTDYLKYKWLWILLMIVLGPFSFLILGFVFNCYDSDAWYMKWYVWILAVLLVLPAIAMFIYLIADLISKSTFYLKSPLNKLYKYPFVWLLCFVPKIGIYVFLILYGLLILTVGIKLIVSREDEVVE